MENSLAFGRGGFCIQSTRQLGEGPVALLLDFQMDHRKVTGHGLVRWTASPEPEVGIEITYIDDDNRAWILDLTGPNKSVSFIPRTTTTTATPPTTAEAQLTHASPPPVPA